MWVYGSGPVFLSDGKYVVKRSEGNVDCENRTSSSEAEYQLTGNEVVVGFGPNTSRKRSLKALRAVIKTLEEEE
jgi:hypothetical protein